jgi:hypothetical protein
MPDFAQIPSISDDGRKAAFVPLSGFVNFAKLTFAQLKPNG